MAKRSRGESFTSPSDQQFSDSPQLEPDTSGPSSPAKYTHLDTAAEDAASDAHEVMRCSLAPHREPISFASYEEYEVHYIQAHVNRCSECGRNFPTELFLSLHIEENHDPLIEARKERGEKTYGCFVEDCERKCSTPQKRRMHLIDKHMFPRTYNFFIVNDGIDKHKSMLRSGNTHGRRVSLSAPSSNLTTGPGGGSRSPPHEGRLRRRKFSQSMKTDTHPAAARAPPSPARSSPPATTPSAQPSGNDIADLERSMSALKFVPPSVTSKGGGRRLG